ncbi:hypothetical protein U9M48_012002 [Paspalum notatum var. saurae]|uniref:Uncharacterized protein n=1 Tax=Paspalum notatum var. saurae TaxID=547442 RepID=A0AAQ3SX24_PASNO
MRRRRRGGVGPPQRAPRRSPPPRPPPPPVRRGRRAVQRPLQPLAPSLGRPPGPAVPASRRTGPRAALRARGARSPRGPRAPVPAHRRRRRRPGGCGRGTRPRRTPPHRHSGFPECGAGGSEEARGGRGWGRGCHRAALPQQGRTALPPPRLPSPGVATVQRAHEAHRASPGARQVPRRLRRRQLPLVSAVPFVAGTLALRCSGGVQSRYLFRVSRQCEFA